MSARAPCSLDLTPEQWRAVCQFFPTIAARARRPMVDVRDQTSDEPVKPGPLFKWLVAALSGEQA